MLRYGEEERGSLARRWLAAGRRWETAVFTAAILGADLPCLELNARQEKTRSLKVTGDRILRVCPE